MLDPSKRPAHWEVLKSTQRLKEPYIDVRTDKCRASNGDILDYHVLSYSNWTNIVAFDDQQKLILVDEYRHGIGENVLGLPGGGVDKEDVKDPREAAKAGALRELLEESGYEATDANMIMESMPNPATQNNWVYTFLATNAKDTGQTHFDEGNGELCITVKLDFVELMQATATQQIYMQAMHIAALWSATHFILKSDQLGPEFTELRHRLRAFVGL